MPSCFSGSMNEFPWRVGIGYDVHRLAPQRRLVLGGVEIAHPLGLLGHSDADVLTHAVMDALLGAAGLGDIGQYFPSNDPAYKDADSLVLLRRVCKLLCQAGWAPANLDATVIAESPKLAPHLPAVRERLAGATGLQPEKVSVKATTNEHLGFVGRGEGIAALAVALIQRCSPAL